MIRSTFNKDTRAAVMSKYYSLNGASQTAHLFSSLNVSAPKWSMLNAERYQEISVKNAVSVQGSSATVCKKSVVNLYGITRSKVDHVVTQLRAGQATVRPYMHGKHSNRLNRLTEVTIDSIKPRPQRSLRQSRTCGKVACYAVHTGACYKVAPCGFVVCGFAASACVDKA